MSKPQHETTVLVWKKLYHVVSGGNTTVTTSTVEEILSLYKDKIVNSFLGYLPYTRESFQSWKQHSGLKDIVADDEMCTFLHFLSKELNLDANVAWTVMCNYLMYEYFGKTDELKSIVRYDTNVRCLIDNVWYFYSADRMFLLKSLRHIFENVRNEKNKFHKQFDEFIKSVDMKMLWKNYMKILYNLINEIDNDKAQIVSKDVLERWIHRTNREQVEVIMLLIHIVQYYELNGSELEEIYKLFIRHGFTRHLIYQESNTISRPRDLWDIKCAEIGYILVVAEKYLQQPGTIAKMLSKNVEKNLEILQIQGDNSVVLFTWAVLKTTISNSEEVMEYCNKTVCDLIEKRVFKYLHNLLISEIFEENSAGDLVVQSVCRIMTEFVKICADYTYLHEQDGICHVTAELLRRKGLDVLDYLGPIFKLSLDAFPFVFNPFLEMCKSLLAIPEQYDKILHLLKNIPSFLAEIPWNDRRDKFHLVGTQRLFIDSDLFVIPEGTLVERFRYQGMEFAKFIYPFSFFTLMEQFIKSLSVITLEIGKSWYCYDNLTELVQIGFKFIIHIIKHYKGDFRSDTVLKRLIQRLEIVPTQFSEGPMKNFNFIRLFFEANVTLITENHLSFFEAFNPIVRRRFFPQTINYGKANEEILNQLYYESILFRSLKEEENMKEHNLLLQYLKLIKYTVEKNKCHREVQSAGVWYLLNVAFPLHQQWSYDDRLEQKTICRMCVSIFVAIFQIPDVNETNKSSLEIVTMCKEAFLFEEVLMGSYLSIFHKDKFYLQNLMEEESNWTGRSVSEQMENIRLQMVLILLIYKVRCDLPSTTRCTIDNKINVIAKAVSAYMVNPYNTGLRLLSYRFLEILARDENIPMMSLLGLDYDQVQRLFLDKLRDPMEDDNVKMQILNLISTCIFSQHGMSAALFDVTRTRKWHSDLKNKLYQGDTVADFLIDYLQNIKKSHEYLKSPLQVAILKLMANLWSSRQRHLIEDVINLDAFWPLLVDPLFQEYTHSPSVYAHIFKILGTQLGDGCGSDKKKFLETVEKFLNDEKLVESWQKYMVKTLNNSQLKPSDIEEKQLLFESWMEFLLMVEKEKNIKKISSEKCKYLFMELCLDGVHFSFANVYCLGTWMNMCLVLVTHWGLSFKNKEQAVIKKIVDMYAILKLHYSGLDSQTRTTILTIVLSILSNLKGHFQSNTVDLLNFLEEIGSLMDYEYKNLEEHLWVKVSEGGVETRELTIPWLTCVQIANKLLKMNNVGECSLWFGFRNYLQNVLKTICKLINKSHTLSLAKVGIYSLQLYVESPLAFDFFNFNMTDFYDCIESPLIGLFVGQCNKIHAHELEEGWVTYTILMKFNKAFLKKFQYQALSSCYSFITLHEQILLQIMNIPECTVAIKALDLLLNTLAFFDSIMVYWQTEWYRKSNHTYNLIMMNVKKIINSCLYIILRPKNIVMYSLDDYHRLNQIDKVPMSLMVVVMNRLIAITGLCFSMLYRTNPDLVSLMGVDVQDTVNILIQNDFSVPKFELPIPYEMTYGKLLCLAHFMCKALDALTAGTQSAPAAEEAYEEHCGSYIGFVEHQDGGHTFPNQKLGAYLRYAMYEYSGLADPWIRKLEPRHVKKSLELLMTFLAQQVFLYIRESDSDSLPYFKRNLASELQFFYEHVKKHTSMFFASHITPTTISSYKSDMDIIKRYLVHSRQSNKYLEVADHNFGVPILHWFTKICHVH